MVEFMTRYPGLYCVIVAGYEREMVRYFLPTNEGLSRRFPFKFVLRDMDADDLVTVFKRAVLTCQDLDDTDPAAADAYFTADAYRYLRMLTHECLLGAVAHETDHDAATGQTYTRVRRFHPRWNLLYEVFKNQAGSMTLLADEAVHVLFANLSFVDVASLASSTAPSRTLRVRRGEAGGGSGDETTTARTSFLDATAASAGDAGHCRAAHL